MPDKKYHGIIFTECNGSIGWGRDAGAYTVASQLRTNGYNILVIDFFSHFDEKMWRNIIKKYVSRETVFLGFSSTHMSQLLPENWEEQYSEDHRTKKHKSWDTYFIQSPEIMNSWINFARRQQPKIKILVGGQKVAQKKSLQKKYPFVDLWIGGMADVSIVKIIDQLSQGIELPKRIRSELDYGSISEDEFSKSQIHWSKDDFLFPNEAVPLEISRGCPFRCSFCDYYKRKMNSWIKSETLLKEQLIELWENFKVKDYMITDFIVNENMNKMNMIWKVFTSLPFKPSWSGFGRLELIGKYPEMVHMIHESGAKAVQWGIESINAKVGPYIGKNTKVDEVEQLLDACRSVWKDDIIMGSGFIIGLPGDTPDDARITLKWLVAQKWLHGWEVTPLFIGLYDEKKAYTIDFSKIQKSPQSYGYEVLLEKKNDQFHCSWKNDSWTHQDTIDLIENFQRTPQWKKRLVATYHGYSRIQNLGFSHNEILSMNRVDQSWLPKLIKNYNSMAHIYFKRIF